MPTNDDPTLKIIRLTPDLWEAYRTIRLRGLIEDPQAFARCYEEENAFPQERWLERARNPYSFIAVENGIPLGTMSAFIQPDDQTTAVIVGVFVAKEARGRGIGSQLMRAILGTLKQEPSIKTVKLTVNQQQIAAVNLYEKFSFRITGEEAEKSGDGIERMGYQMELHF